MLASHLHNKTVVCRDCNGSDWNVQAVNQPQGIHMVNRQMQTNLKFERQKCRHGKENTMKGID